MANILSFVNNKTKTLLGIISIIICLILWFIKPFYVEWYFVLFLIPAIGFILPIDSIDLKNSRMLGILTFLLVIIILYLSFKGYSNAYHTMTDLYLTNQISHLPTTAEISNCTNTYLMIMIYAIYNILCGIVYFIPTSDEEDDF